MSGTSNLNSPAAPQIRHSPQLRVVGPDGQRTARVVSTVPFVGADATAGSETELQAAVCGSRDQVDLPRRIEQSNYFANLLKRAAAEDSPRRGLRLLERYLSENREAVWENSWVRLPVDRLSPLAREILQRDLQYDRHQTDNRQRNDLARFFVSDQAGKSLLRVPISYLLKLSLADVLGTQPELPAELQTMATRLMDHLISDNNSPETVSFYTVSNAPQSGTGIGEALAEETALRFLLTQLLVFYANSQFGLQASGQRAVLYSAPHPPVRQQQLNDCISDAFYRELFTSPCLSGWDCGEDKQDYMRLCHEVLSRSQLNAVAKVRDAGLIASSLIVLPNLSNMSLANNGIHISIGSRQLQQALEEGSSGFTPAEEKRQGDLVIKIVEHFLPLFVGTCSAAPWRVDFADFHAEQMLGFLPHQLDFTHLRMMWRRWKKKARLSLFGQPISPTGYEVVDRTLSRILRLRGDHVADYRLLSYLIAPLSTDQCPALNGLAGNQERLKQDLADQGVFDTRLSWYALYRQRTLAGSGYCGFEGRFYSLCRSFGQDLAPAANLQLLITALAWRYVSEGTITHADIPDDPSTESERRQIFFGKAAGIPTFYVHTASGNRFLMRIARNCHGSRPSRRYPGYLRIRQRDWQDSLISLLRSDAADLIEQMGLHATLDDLAGRLARPEETSAAGRITGAILDELGVSSPMAVPAAQFNQSAEKYYRETLRRQHVAEGLDYLKQHWNTQQPDAAEGRELAQLGLGLRGVGDFLTSIRHAVLHESLNLFNLRLLLNLVLLTVRRRSEEEQARGQQPLAPYVMPPTAPGQAGTLSGQASPPERTPERTAGSDSRPAAIAAGERT